ncbi:P2Y purinoceptor 2-like [Denticeps clupeoides]|uniref:G-protein coupled receptors family 1 profile domain-containing protein n=1 Tax=Denticeps clupeoides TaxID=299321 RepID=A0AAY4EKG3_9TELE|nr:P2Y purinoceptor 2-like [Denticeps clupeoides]
MVLPSVLPTNTTSNTSECSADSQSVYVAVFLCLVFLLGFCLNVFSLYVFCCRMSHWNSSTVLQFNLALSDSVGTPAILMMVVHFANDGNWPFGVLLCHFKIVLLSMHFYGSTTFLMLISIHRYVAVVHFNRSCPMKRKCFVKKLCVGIWLFLLTAGIIYSVLVPAGKEQETMQCLNINQRGLSEQYLIINFILLTFWFILPFCTSAACYGGLVNSVARINVKTLKGPSIKAKSLRMIGTCLLIFGLCFLPLHVTRTIGVMVVRYHPEKCDLLRKVETAYYVSLILGGINSCLDPLIYFFGTNSFRKTIRRSIKVVVSKRRIGNRSESETVTQSMNRIVIDTIAK